MPSVFSDGLTSIELFTGAGGLALGVSRAGFRHIALVEINKTAVASVNENRPRVGEMHDWPADFSPTDVDDIDFDAYRDSVSLIAAGAPCQPFSLGGKHQGYEDKRNLFPAVFKAVRAVRPKAVIVENVKGLLRKSFSEYREYIELQLSHPDVPQRDGEDWRSHKDRLSTLTREPLFHVKHFLLNAANYGLPQRRERVFIVAIRRDIGTMWKAPPQTHSEDALLFEQWVSGVYWHEHGFTPPPMPHRLNARIGKLARLSRDEIPTKRWRTVRDALRGLPEPLNGGEAIGFHNHVANPGARSYHGHTGSPLDMPAKTLKAGDHGVPGGENMLVRDDGTVRYFTIREAARLQGFPDEYLFRGAWTEAFRQLGNAVPVELAQAVAEGVKRIIEVGVEHEKPAPSIQLPLPVDAKQRPLATNSETRI